MRTLTLPEHGQLPDVALDLADVDVLAPYCPRQLTLTPDFSGDGYVLAAGSWVGTIRTPSVALVIEPKVALSQLLFLLSYTIDPHRWRDMPFDYQATASLAEAIIPGFVHQVRRAIRQGLLHGYRSHRDTLTTVRGRVELPEQLRRHYGRSPPVEVAYDEFTDDMVENRLLKAAIYRLSRLRLRSASSRGGLRTLASAFDRVAHVAYDPRGLPEIAYTRLNQHYRPAVELARLILRATSFDLAHGAVRSSAFLVDMNQVFEAFVVVALREALDADERSFPTATRAPSLRLDDARKVPIKPDLTWLQHSRPVFVGDVKYKALGGTDHQNADLYQALAYTVATGLSDAVLIYAAGEVEQATHSISSVGKRLHVRTLNLAATPDGILKQVRRLATDIRSLVERSARPGSPTAA